MERAGVFTISNSNGMRLDVIPTGGAITRLFAPDRRGIPVDVVLGFDETTTYRKRSAFLGALIGRYGNRIRNGRFSLDGDDYELARNQPPNHLHGGNIGFDVREWSVGRVEHAEGQALALQLVSPDGEEGYPGRLEIRVQYVLSDENALIIIYEAETDRPTILNPTQHAYFNLAGHASGDILDQRLMIAADRFTPTDISQIPTGEIEPVAATPLDFRGMRRIGDEIDSDDEQIRIGAGFDHNFVLNEPQAGDHLRLAARVESDSTGISMDVRTDQPGLQFYSGNHLNGITGKDGAIYGPHTGFCVETQHFPDSPNHPHFPSTVLRPGERFSSRTEYRFGNLD